MAINIKKALSDAGNAVKTFFTPKTGTLATAGRNFLQTPVRVSPQTEKFIQSVPTLGKIKNRVVESYKFAKNAPNPWEGESERDWKTIQDLARNPKKIPSAAVNATKNFISGAFTPPTPENIPEISRRMHESPAYGLGSGLSFAIPPALNPVTNPVLQKIGRAQLGKNAIQTGKNIVSRAIQGGLLGTGLTAVGTPLTQGRLATGPELWEATKQGVNTSWQLAFTNDLTNKFAAKFLPKLTTEAIDKTFKLMNNEMGITLKNAAQKSFNTGIKQLFWRAMLEVPAENTMFTAMDKLSGKEKDDFISAWVRNLPGNILGNALFAGVSAISPTIKMYKFNNLDIGDAQEALFKTASELGYLKPGMAGSPAPVETGPLLSNQELAMNQLRKGAPEGPELTNEQMAMNALTQNRGYGETAVPFKLKPGELPTYDVNGNIVAPAVKAPETLPTYDLDGNIVPPKTGFSNQELGMKQLQMSRGELPVELPAKPVAPENIPLKVETPEPVVPEIKKAISTKLPTKQEPGIIDSFDNLFARWIGKRDAAKTSGIQEAVAQTVPQEYASDVIQYMEGTKTDVAPEVKDIAAGLRSKFDELFARAKDAGMDIGYLQNYLTHIWKESPTEVEALYKSAKETFRFAGNRKVPTYEEGLQMGLSPKYNNPTAILGEYVQKMEETIANMEFIRNLKLSQIIVKAGDLGKLPNRGVGYEPIIGPGFPTSKSRTSKGDIVIGNFYAPSNIARQVNQVFSQPNTSGTEGLIAKAAGVSSAIQDIVLSGGAPKTPLNAWTAAQILFKELPAGRVTGPLKALWHSMVDANQYFKDNLPYIKKMQEANIPVNTSLDLKSLDDGSWMSKQFGNSWGEAWHKIVNEATFKKFMPILQVEFYKDSLRSSTKKYGVQEGERIAAQATKNFYGILGSDVLAKQSELGKNLKKTFLMAPTYRETILHFLKNTITGLKDPLAPENVNNTRWLVGAVLTYGIYDYFNLQSTGNHMWENPPGLEDKLLIPAGETTIGIPFMSSILTVPRAGLRVGKELLAGDIKGAVTEAGQSGVSLALAPFFDLVKGSDYFGREIVNENDSPQTKIKKQVTYIATRYMHPYIKELVDPRSVDDPAYQRISRALEMPIRYYDTKGVDARWYFKAKEDAMKSLDPTERAVYDKLYKPKKLDEDGLPISGTTARDTIANALDRLSNPNVVAAETQTAIETAKKTGENPNPFYLLSPQQQETVLVLKTFYPGDTESKKIIIDANKDWLQVYWKARDGWVQQMKDNGTFTSTFADTGKPQITPELQTKLDEYFTLPSGTGARTAYLRRNPEVLTYFQDNQDWTNAQRAELGLPLQGGGSGGYGSGGSSRASFKKPPVYKAPKIKSVKPQKISPLKLSKTPSFKIPARPGISKKVYKPTSIKLSKPKGLPMTLSGLRLN